MTTIIGIRGFDMNRKKDYVLLASDSQITTLENNRIVLVNCNGTKIYPGKNNQYLFAYAGRVLDPEINPSVDIKSRGIFNSLLKENFNVIQLKENLKELGKIYESAFLIGSAFERNLKIQSYTFFKNENSMEEVYSEGHVGLWRGSGGEFARSIMKDEIKKNKKGREDNKKILLPIEESLLLCLTGLKEATKEDIYTGGHMDFGVMTKSGWRRYLDFAPLGEDKDFLELKEKAVEDFRVKTSFQGNTLDSILLD